MQCTLLIPHLFWPRETAEAVANGLELPALATLLGHARAEPFDAVTAEAWLCQAFQVERQQDWPIAPLTLQLDGCEPGDAYWLRADPVHLKLERDRLLLIENALFDLSSEEARAFVDTLNQHWDGAGIAFYAPVPKRWYARLAHVPKLITHALSEVAGQDVQPHLPSGADALQWHRTFNEVQMLLHGHAGNEEREARGDPAVNSVWFWGGGMRTPVRGSPYTWVWSNEAVAVALAAAADIHATALPANAAEWMSAAEAQVPVGSSHLIVSDELSAAAVHHDASAWRERLAALEARWFAPLAQALRKGRLSHIAIVAPGGTNCWRFDLKRSDLLKFWRSGKRWSEYA